MIDSEWFYQKLDKKERSLRDMAKALGLNASAVSRMLRGERKMSAEEQDGIADYLGVSVLEVASRRRGEGVGFAERGQEPFSTDGERPLHASEGHRVKADAEAPSDTNPTGADNFYDRIRGCMKGTVTIPPGVDLTAPADPDWGKVYDD